MTRMLDHLRRGGLRSVPGDETVTTIIDACAAGPCRVFDVTNVWQYVDSRFAGEKPDPARFDPLRDFPIVTPPFGLSWWEWKVKREEGYTPDAIGVAVEVVDMFAADKTAPVPADIRADLLHIKQRAAALDHDPAYLDHLMNEVALRATMVDGVDVEHGRDLSRLLDDRIRWMAYVTVAFQDGTSVWGPLAVFMVPIGPNGSLLPVNLHPTTDDDPAMQEIFGGLVFDDRHHTLNPNVPFACAGRLTVAGAANFGVPRVPSAEQGMILEVITSDDSLPPDVLRPDLPVKLDYDQVDRDTGHHPGLLRWDQTPDALLDRRDGTRSTGPLTRIEPGSPTHATVLAEAQRMAMEAGRAAHRRIMAIGLYPFLQAVTFTHLRNTTVHTVTPPPKVSARHRRKHGEPLVRYEVIEIRPLKEALAARTGGRRTGPISLHIPRGHFAHYGDCCDHASGGHEPKGLLFGRHEGRFWIPPHVRGRAAAGIVLADYEVTGTEDA